MSNWKAVTIDVTKQYEQGKSAVDFEEIPYVDRYVFDSKADNRQNAVQDKLLTGIIFLPLLNTKSCLPVE